MPVLYFEVGGDGDGFPWEIDLINDLGATVATPSDADGVLADMPVGYGVLILFMLSMVLGAILGKGFFK